MRLVESAAHAAGWALFADKRVALAVARGSGVAVAQLGAVARQHGVPVSLHGTGRRVDRGVGARRSRRARRDRRALARPQGVQHDERLLRAAVAVAASFAAVVAAAADRAAAERGAEAVVHRVASDRARPARATNGSGRTSPEFWLVEVDTLADAVELFNRYSPRLAASLISEDQHEQDWFYCAVDAPFVGNGFTRWVDGQFALDQPELGLSNWQSGRLFARSGVLSGDSVYTVRLRAEVRDHSLHR